MLKGQGTFGGEGKHLIFQTFIVASMWNINYKLKSIGSNKYVQLLPRLQYRALLSKLDFYLGVPNNK
jgi:hypothetical protein